MARELSPLLSPRGPAPEPILKLLGVMLLRFTFISFSLRRVLGIF